MKTIKLKTPLSALALIAWMLFTSTALATDEKPNTFDLILAEYEKVRLTLTGDTLDGVAQQGEKIHTLLENLAADWSPVTAGVKSEMAQEVRELLPQLSEAASALASAETLDTARDAFYELSKPLVRWRKAATGDRPAVAYCPMIKRSWLQPEGTIGNPYHGQEMHRCGDIVDG